MRYFPQIFRILLLKTLILPITTLALLVPQTAQSNEIDVWQGLECRVALAGAPTADTPNEWLGQFEALSTRITDPTSESDKAAAISELQVTIAQYFGMGGPNLLTEPTRWQRLFRGAPTAFAQQEAFSSERMGAFQTWLENFGARLVLRGRRAFLETRAQPTAFGVVNEILPPELLLPLLATTGAEVLLQGPGAVREHRVGQLIVDVLTLGDNGIRVTDTTVYNLNPSGRVTVAQTNTRIEEQPTNAVVNPPATPAVPATQPAATGGTVRPRTTTLVGPRAPTVEQPSGTAPAPTTTTPATAPTAATPAAAQPITHTQVFGTPAAVNRATTPAQGTQALAPPPAVAATAAPQVATPPPLPIRGEQLSLPFTEPTTPRSRAGRVGEQLPLPLGFQSTPTVGPAAPTSGNAPRRRDPRAWRPRPSRPTSPIDSPTSPPPAAAPADGRRSIVDQFDLSATDGEAPAGTPTRDEDGSAPDVEILDLHDEIEQPFDWSGRNFGGAPNALNQDLADPIHAALATAITGAPAAEPEASTTESLATLGSAPPPANPPAGEPVAPAPATPETPAATTNETTLPDALVAVGREILTDLFGGDAPVADAPAAAPSPTPVSVLRSPTPVGGWGIPVASAAAERAASAASGAHTAPFGTAAVAGNPPAAAPELALMGTNSSSNNAPAASSPTAAVPITADTGEVVMPALLVPAAPVGPAPDAEAPATPVLEAIPSPAPTPVAAPPARRPSPRMNPNDPNTVTMAATARIQVLTESTAALANNVAGLAQAIGSNPLGVLPGTGVNIPFQHFLRSYRVLTSTVALTESNLPGTRAAVDAFTHELVQALRAVQQGNPNLSLTALLTTVVGGLTISDNAGQTTITAVDAKAPEVFSALLAELNRHNPNVGALPRQALEWTGEPHPEGTPPSDPFFRQLSQVVRGLLLKTTVLAHPNANPTATAVVRNYADFLNPAIGAEAMGLSETHPLRAVSSTLAAINARGTEENAPTALTATQTQLVTVALDYVLEHLNQRPVEYPLALNPAVGFPTADDYNAIVEALVRRWTFQTHADLLRASDQALREQGSWWARARSRLTRWFGRGQNTAPGGLSLRQVLEWRDSFAHSYSAIWARILAERAGNDSTNGQNDPVFANATIRTKLAALIQKLTPTQRRP